MSTRMEKLKCTFNYTATTTHVILGRRLISNTTATASLQSLQLYEHTPLRTQLSKGDHEGQSIYVYGQCYHIPGVPIRNRVHTSLNRLSY